MADGKTSRGTNSSGMRLYNERLVLSLIRKAGRLPKAEIARQTGLSAQTISVIMRSLDNDELVRREERVKGNIGQPSVPFSLNNEGAFSIGLKIGRRSAELVVIDFVGSTVKSLDQTYDYPTPERVLAFVRQGLKNLVEDFSKKHLGRIAGVGIAIPSEMWNWAEECGAPAGAMDGWLTCDIRDEVSQLCDWRVYMCNDATAACAAELVFGAGARINDFLYLFVGAFVGGGLVLDGKLVAGRNGNAAAIGPLPVHAKNRDEPMRLINCASLYLLEAKLAEEGRDPSLIWRSPDGWNDLGAVLDQWIDDAATNLSYACLATLSILDIEAVILDGIFPCHVRARLLAKLQEKFNAQDLRGLSSIELLEGSIGPSARAIGGSCLPFLDSFARDHEVLFKYRHVEPPKADTHDRAPLRQRH